MGKKLKILARLPDVMDHYGPAGRKLYGLPYAAVVVHL